MDPNRINNVVPDILVVQHADDSERICAHSTFGISALCTSVIRILKATIGNFSSNQQVFSAQTPEVAGNLGRALMASRELNCQTVRREQQPTYVHRADAALRQVLPGRTELAVCPRVSTLVPTNHPGQNNFIFQALARQIAVKSQRVLLVDGIELPESSLALLKEKCGIDDVALLSAGRDVSLGECQKRGVGASSGDVLTRTDDADHCGPNYLTDQLFVQNFSGSDFVCRHSQYKHLATSNATALPLTMANTTSRIRRRANDHGPPSGIP